MTVRAASGTLFVVATPIGNLGDVTLRALEVLRTVPLVACEDTRVTRRLVARHGIDARLVSFHARSAPRRLDELLEHLRSGSDLAITTDAGTPSVSDPGEALVAAWAGEGGSVVPIPGPSAAIAAISAAGLAGPRWSFEGFLPRAGTERRRRLARLAEDDRGAVLYEAPTRLAALLRDLVAACGGDRPAAVCRELTKLHEQIARGPLDELSTAVSDGRILARGEVAVVLGAWPTAGRGAGTRSGPEAPAPTGHRELRDALVEVDALVTDGIPRAAAARQVARRTGLARRLLYRPPASGAAD